MVRRQQAETLDAQASAALSARVGEARRFRGWSQQRLAVQAGLSIGTVRAIETGRIKDPGIFTVRSIALALGLSLNEMVVDTASEGEA
ncbi:MAG TPA: helix-turn-helix transcriptional regulator [Terrimesophilobacter sp.]|nr:helix-turn-helix transcriptional regulator [Terrimesophilobacter sp.]